MYQQLVRVARVSCTLWYTCLRLPLQSSDTLLPSPDCLLGVVPATVRETPRLTTIR